ncbi:CDP-alcohol phosphatidyltransferase family protein [Patescibacteria group bacterium]|nr:CDP-alcohol phosphatidyltransferase family protein [Patescibacteria group bacterium]MBU1034398.1 CDP-alcohol phosphatidyltransferase family protein [Patescibacteria group bacterium]MBU1629457.1 CDP-alcohol phosphatidyltransferase family protein [Patescibacteria group bacterium]MBU1908011.1 CDP-alcohol phosphatidyltransferase family protein [Patescibacteria group bacterium]
MLITNETAKVYPHDRLLSAVLIRFLPKQLHPNHITLLRFLLIPFVLWYVWKGDWSVAVPLFVFAAFTDALDGSIARIRKEITVWGTFADPAADKLLIGSVVVLFVAKEVNSIFAAIIVLVEALILLTGLIRRKKKWVISANWAGKLKMLFQVIGVTMLLVAKWSGLSLLVPFSIGTLTIAIVFAVVSLLTYSL